MDILLSMKKTEVKKFKTNKSYTTFSTKCASLKVLNRI
jgi:hypothetical protein